MDTILRYNVTPTPRMWKLDFTRVKSKDIHPMEESEYVDKIDVT